MTALRAGRSISGKPHALLCRTRYSGVRVYVAKGAERAARDVTSADRSMPEYSMLSHSRTRRMTRSVIQLPRSAAPSTAGRAALWHCMRGRGRRQNWAGASILLRVRPAVAAHGAAAVERSCDVGLAVAGSVAAGLVGPAVAFAVMGESEARIRPWEGRAEILRPPSASAAPAHCPCSGESARLLRLPWTLAAFAPLRACGRPRRGRGEGGEAARQDSCAAGRRSECIAGLPCRPPCHEAGRPKRARFGVGTAYIMLAWTACVEHAKKGRKTNGQRCRLWAARSHN